MILNLQKPLFRYFLAIFIFCLLHSSELLSQTTPTDTTTHDRTMMGTCQLAATAAASTNPVCSGGTTNLSISGALGYAFPQYQWEKSTTSAVAGFAAIAGATSATYTSLAISVPTWYRCQISDGSGGFFCTTGYITAVGITVSAAPTASAAGVDQSACATTATLAGNTPASGTGTWTLVSGSGTITTPSSATSGLTALGAGANTFRWTIANSPCTSSTDDVIITNNTASGGTASATTCATSSTLTLSGYNGTIQWQQSVNAGAWANIGGATTTPYSATLVYGNSYDFRANVTSCAATVASTTASVAAGGASTNYTFGSPSLALSVYNGYCLANYTFTQSTTAARGSAINTGVTVTINFMAGTDATTMTSGTFNGVAINMGTVVKTATSVTFTTPTSVCANTAFTIVLNGITNPPWATSGNATVSIPNASGGIDSYSTYSATIATTLLAFYDEAIGGGSPTYATSNGLGHCVNNLTAGVTYCYNFVYPSSGDIKASIRIDLGTAPGGCGTSSQYMSVSPALGGGCASTLNSNMNQFESECTSHISGGMGVGATCGTGMTAGTVYTVCYTVPAGCSGLNICPLINCTAGSCGGGGTSLPIELMFFDAVMDGGVVKLSWATASETNNDYFSIERTYDAKLFTVVGTKINGAGNSSSVLNYSAVDETPLKGISYYRIMQTDFDGKYSYSKLVSVELNTESPLKLMYVSPDQTKNSLQYQFSYSENNSLLVEVVDVIGQTVYSQKVSSDYNGQALQIDASGFNKGLYLLKISDGIYSQVKKFVY